LGARAEALRAVAEEAEARGAHAYLVGGPVRDLLLGTPVDDLDVLLSDALEPVARATAARLRGKLTLHARFLTATVQSPDVRVDLARARSERYARPGALPFVESASVDADLGRRDFSVHALALPLSASSGATLLDPYAGRKDLERRVLRVLHDASFRDDPTRLYRAARYAARLRFRLEPETLRLARAALRDGAVASVSGARILHELERGLVERRPDRTARETAALGLYRALAPGWRRADERGLERLARCAQKPPWPEAADLAIRAETGLRLLLAGAPARARSSALARLSLRGRPGATILSDLASLQEQKRALNRSLSAGALDARLAGVSEAGLLLAYCAGADSVPRQVARYARHLRHKPSPLDGHQARALGARAAEIGAMLRAARVRALDGKRVDERWLRGWLAKDR
jgi:tRNA nucleotidyltransferase (CCA-adding enzyme)